MAHFKTLGINDSFIKGLTDLKINQPTEIQERIIPILLSGKTDIVGQAQTGTGKTAAYGLPLLQQINVNKKVIQGLILCPTRELGKQVAKQLFRFTKYSQPVFTEAVYGGEPIDRQIANLQRPTHIIVATPGRLVDLISRKIVDLSQVNTVILDEADEMLSMGFKTDLEAILNHVPKSKSTWLFSATMPAGVQDIISHHITTNAPRIVINPKNIVNNQISHQYVVCDEAEKLFVLLQFLKTKKNQQGFIFCRTKVATQALVNLLIEKQINVDVIHGDLLQKERDKVMRALKNKKTQLLVATDVAARGIDVEGLSFVVHYQLPDNDEYYIHRSGRTARAGKNGISLCFVNAKEIRKIRTYEQNLKIKFDRVK